MDVETWIEALRLEGVRMADAAAAVGPGRTGPDAVPSGSCATWCATRAGSIAGPPAWWPTPRTEVWAVGLDEVVGTWPSDDDAGGVVPSRATPPWWLRSRRPRPTSSAGPSCAPRRPWPTGPGARPTRRPSTGSTPSWPRAWPLSPIDAAPGGRRGRRAALWLRAPAQHPAACRHAGHAAGAQHRYGRGLGVADRRRGGVGASGRRRARRTDGTLGRRRRRPARCRGTAEDLYLALWNRGRRETLTVEGDGAVLAQFLQSVQVR